MAGLFSGLVRATMAAPAPAAGGAAVRVACFLSAKKQRHLDFPTIQAAAQRHGLELVVVETPQDVAEGDYGVVLHKLTDAMSRAQAGSAEDARFIAELKAVLASPPQLRVVDPLESVAVLTNRFLTCEAVKRCEEGAGGAPGPQVLLPQFVHVPDGASDAAGLLAEAGLEFPVLCKPIVAHGSPRAHEMQIIFNAGGLPDATPPCILQQYHRHSGVLFKIFVVGEAHYLERRPSLRNMGADFSRTTLSFNSHAISKPTSQSELNAAGWAEALELDTSFVPGLVTRMREQLQLSLFGVDVIVEEGTGTVFVVDVNYFPGYKGVGGFPDVLSRHLARAAPP